MLSLQQHTTSTRCHLQSWASKPTCCSHWSTISYSLSARVLNVFALFMIMAYLRENLTLSPGIACLLTIFLLEMGNVVFTLHLRRSLLEGMLLYMSLRHLLLHHYFKGKVFRKWGQLSRLLSLLLPLIHPFNFMRMFNFRQIQLIKVRGST